MPKNNYFEVIVHGDAVQMLCMYANHDLPNLETVIRSLYGFIQKLSVSQNSIVRTIDQSWLVGIKLWDVCAKVLYL